MENKLVPERYANLRHALRAGNGVGRSSASSPGVLGDHVPAQTGTNSKSGPGRFYKIRLQPSRFKYFSPVFGNFLHSPTWQNPLKIQ